MKAKGWRWLFFGITMFLLIASVIVPLAIDWKRFKPIFFVILIISVVGWIIYLIVYLIQLFGKSAPVEKLDVKNIINNELNEIQMDRNMGDNAILDDFDTGNFGSKGSETPIVAMYWHGTEKKGNCVSIINMNNPKQVSRRTNLTDTQIEFLKQIMAEHPDIRGTESIERVDPFSGRTFEKVKRTLPSSQQERDAQEKKELEEKTTI